jgi:hypothetical protein
MVDYPAISDGMRDGVEAEAPTNMSHTLLETRLMRN